MTSSFEVPMRWKSFLISSLSVRRRRKKFLSAVPACSGIIPMFRREPTPATTSSRERLKADAAGATFLRAGPSSPTVVFVREAARARTSATRPASSASSLKARSWLAASFAASPISSSPAMARLRTWGVAAKVSLTLNPARAKATCALVASEMVLDVREPSSKACWFSMRRSEALAASRKVAASLFWEA